MKFFVGLGNPGKKYANNRHNIGFMALNQISTDHSFSSWKHKFQGQISSGTLGMEKIILLKPDTFMNLSGKSVSEVTNFFKIPSKNVFVFYDELDLDVGKIKFKTGGGNAGHNGLRSIDQFIDNNYNKIRVGIGHPGDKNKVTGHVLGDFYKEDKLWLEPLLRAVGKAAIKLVSGNGVLFLNEIGLLLKPNETKEIK